MKHLREKFPSIKVLIILAMVQVHSSFLFSNLHYWEQDHHLKLTCCNISWKICGGRTRGNSQESSVEAC